MLYIKYIIYFISQNRMSNIFLNHCLINSNFTKNKFMIDTCIICSKYFLFRLFKIYGGIRI